MRRYVVRRYEDVATGTGTAGGRTGMAGSPTVGGEATVACGEATAAGAAGEAHIREDAQEVTTEALSKNSPSCQPQVGNKRSHLEHELLQL